jgi:segregation and condensation protein B
MTDYKNKIESLLFASGRFLDMTTLLNLTGASGKQVLRNNIDRLKQEYDERESPLMIVEEKDGWKLTVRETYLPLVRNIVSEMELTKTVLETMSVIAWKAPVLQSEIIDIRHNKAYEHIKELEELGFVRKDSEGRSYRLNLTEKFFEYFDVDGARDIRDIFNKVVEQASQAKVDDFETLSNMPDWYHQGAKFLDNEPKSVPEWYLQGEKFLDKVDNEKEFTDLDQAPQNNVESEEFSEL